MKIRTLHNWDITPAEAIAIQRTLAGTLTLTPPPDYAPRTIAAADMSCDLYSRTLFAAIVVVALPGLEVIETVTARAEVAFPYVPGLLSFREIPALIPAVESLRHVPGAIITDGHGLAHPRRFGLACHLVLMLDCPVIGCAKTRLCGQYPPPADTRGAHSPVSLEGDIVAAALRTRAGASPVFVSQGNRIDLTSAIATVMAVTDGRARVPLPLRLAHEAANAARRAALPTTGT